MASDIEGVNLRAKSMRQQAGHRPAFVISPLAYNQRSNLALFCPITSKIKGWKFEVILMDSKIKGAILADQIKSLDWQARKIDFIEKASENIINEVIGKIETLLN